VELSTPLSWYRSAPARHAPSIQRRRLPFRLPFSARHPRAPLSQRAAELHQDAPGPLAACVSGSLCLAWPVPRELPSLTDAGLWQTEAGDLYGWGSGLDYMLQLKDDDDWLFPSRMDGTAFGGARVLQADGGAAFSAAVTDDGGLYTFGEGGPWLGLGQGGPSFGSGPQRSPTAVPSECFRGARVVMTSCGAMHQCALTDSGDVYCWGQGGSRLGHGDEESREVPTIIGQEMFGGCSVALVACGNVHTAAVTRSGALYTWGYGGEGRLGHGDTVSRMVYLIFFQINIQHKRLVCD
jgi:alpha-tubulin suppressor-like RCC1 family protein